MSARLHDECGKKALILFSGNTATRFALLVTRNGRCHQNAEVRYVVSTGRTHLEEERYALIFQLADQGFRDDPVSHFLDPHISAETLHNASIRKAEYEV
jgi:hypothetical protein